VNSFEKKIGSVKLRSVEKSLDLKMDALFKENSERNATKFGRFLAPMLILAASLAFVLGTLCLFAELSGPANPKIISRRQPVCGSSTRRRTFVVALDKELSPVFGINEATSESFFDSEKIELKRLAFSRPR
jgi:hypothetical protein